MLRTATSLTSFPPISRNFKNFSGEIQQSTRKRSLENSPCFFGRLWRSVGVRGGSQKRGHFNLHSHLSDRCLLVGRELVLFNPRAKGNAWGKNSRPFLRKGEVTYGAHVVVWRIKTGDWWRWGSLTTYKRVGYVATRDA